MDFDSGYEPLCELPRFTPRQLGAEPRLDGPLSAVDERAGPVLRAFIAALPDDLRAPDTWVHARCVWLKAGWWAGCDRYQRHLLPASSARAVAPSLDAERDRVAVGAMFGDVAPMRFLVGGLSLPDLPRGPHRDALWRAYIERQRERGTVTERLLPPSLMVRFGPGDFHTFSPAARAGWRLFARAFPARFVAMPDDTEHPIPAGPRNVTRPLFPGGQPHIARLYLPYEPRPER